MLNLVRPRRFFGVLLSALIAASCGGGSGGEAAPADNAAAPADAAPAAAAESSGPIVVGRAPAALGPSPTVIVLEPKDQKEIPAPAETPVMDQVQREFTPALLVARAGHPILFLNNDPELHNLNVKDGLTMAQAFNVAIPQGGKYTHTLQKPGIYDVSCDIHPTMSAAILATASPYVAYADETGAFSLTGVPPGSYVAKAVGGFPMMERTVEVTDGRTEIDFTRR